MIPVILSGGSGTRLWPVSRATHPKQFWPLVADKSLLQETLDRLKDHADTEAPIIVCNAEHRFFVAHQLEALSKKTGETLAEKSASIILEPVAKNTAPAVAIAAIHALASSKEADPILLILPADHVIENIEAFHNILSQGEQLAEQGSLVTFGIVPTQPETGYGYIKGGEEIAGSAKTIDSFVEKPNKATAESYLQSGDYFWNSGMFMFRASRFLEELKKFSPAILKATQESYEKSLKDLDFIRLDTEAFAQSPSDSIDYAVMEHTKEGVVIPLDAGWSDIGSWSALWDIGEKDEQGNVMVGDVLSLDTENCYLRSDGRLLATMGIQDLVVVDTPDVVMVAPREQVQKVKEMVALLNQHQREEINIHAEVHRPWGCYKGIDAADGYQVKRITVKPGGRLSLQKHQHRAEHWIVVAGEGQITCGDRVFTLKANESTYIPMGEKHRLENLGEVPLEMIEVQSGSYLGEDDIERFEDVYGR